VYLIDAGRCFILAGDNEKAIQVLNKVRHDYPESKLVSRANELIVRAGGKFEYAPTKMKLF
jgi:hypothetical protein